MLMELLGLKPTGNTYADAAIGTVADPVNLAGVAAMLAFPGMARRAGPRWNTRFSDLKIPPTLDSQRQKLALQHLRRLQDHPDLNRILGEIPPDSEFAGAGAQAMAFRTPEGQIVRIDPRYGGMFQDALRGDVTLNADYTPDEMRALVDLPAPMARVEHELMLPTHRSSAFGEPGRQALVEHSDSVLNRPTTQWTTEAIQDELRMAGLRPRDVYPRNIGYDSETLDPKIFDTDAVLPGGSPESWPLVHPTEAPNSLWNPLLDATGYTQRVRREALGQGNRLPVSPRLLAALGLWNGPAPAFWGDEA